MDAESSLEPIDPSQPKEHTEAIQAFIDTYNEWQDVYKVLATK